MRANPSEGCTEKCKWADNFWAYTAELAQEACAWLSEAGYTGLVENSEGFVGWKKYGLPWKKAGSNSIF